MPSSRQLWLTYNGDTEKLQFPLPPASVNIKKGASSLSVSVQGLGEVVLKQDPTAIAISFSGVFPAARFPGVQVKELTPPYDLKDKITVWQRSDQPVHFLVTGTTVNIYCVIEDFTYYEQGGDPGSLYYTLTLKEYREVRARRINVDAATGSAIVPAGAARTDSRAGVSTYTVVAGDSLYAIAARLLGDGARYKEIADLNSDVIKSPSLIHPGMTLKMPT